MGNGRGAWVKFEFLVKYGRNQPWRVGRTARHKFAKLAGRKSRVGSTPTPSAESSSAGKLDLSIWRRARADDRDRLENDYGRKVIRGSNPLASAYSKIVRREVNYARRRRDTCFGTTS